MSVRFPLGPAVGGVRSAKHLHGDGEGQQVLIRVACPVICLNGGWHKSLWWWNDEQLLV
ncbi:hypothetical protein LINPERPRIM_LOCUS37006 [Linum perenne]